MEKVELYEVTKVTEEVENSYNQPEVTPPKKRRGKSQEDCVDKPKKPRSAYLLYYFDVHQLMQQEVPNLPQSEINKRISESWKRLSVAEKGFYLEKAKLEKEGIETSSLSPFKDLPGFRKILPRASYFLLAKGCSSNPQAEVNVESPVPLTEGGFSLVSLHQEPELQLLGLANEVELSEQSVDAELAEEPPVPSHSTALHKITPSSSSTVSPQTTASADVPLPKSSADLTAVGRASETSGVFGGAVVQHIQGETTQMFAILPSQNLLEPKRLSGVGSVGPVMMLPVGPSEEQSATPSYQMSVKTYTRRGRGRCPHPGCSFVYVTRHKPPTCPECGNHLGGKWIPAAKKRAGKDAAAKQSGGKAEAVSNESTSHPAHEGNTRAGKTAGGRKEMKQRSGKQRAVPSVKTPEGSRAKLREQPLPWKDVLEKAAVQSQSTSSVNANKRPVRAILPACYSTGRALFQIIAVPPAKGKSTLDHNKYAVPPESLSGLKPSTLKQLGQAVAPTAVKQDSPDPGTHPAASLTDKKKNIVSVFKQHMVSSFDLGLSTARGRGHCKNPLCDYMYKNRHKPTVCPKCGCELTQRNTKRTKTGTLLDPYQPLSPAQQDIQRQSTLQLVRRSVQIPEGETELQETLALIQELNSLQIVFIQPSDQEQGESAETQNLVESGWPQFYESTATHCDVCSFPLFKGSQSTVAGQEDCWLLTETLIQTASLQLKVCLNVQCLALHSFTDLHPGLFNVGNRLLVSIDLFLRIRANVKRGDPPARVVQTLLDHVPNHPVHALSPEEKCEIQGLLRCGYWAFECLTVRDYNDMICGVCGVAPKLEIAQRRTNVVLELSNVEFTWPEFSVSDEVHVDDFWLTMESEAVEQALFPADIPMTRVDASIIAPFIPPLMRSSTVINTEKDKVPSQTQQPSGDPSVLVRLIHDGQLRLDKIEDHSEEDLRTTLDRCGVSVPPGATRNELLSSLISWYTTVHSGLSTAPQPPQHLTAGKLSKVCPHKVVCGSKCLVRGETARDHVDLLLSSRYWPPVYVNDCAQQVALCTDLQYPEVAAQMWGRNQGCFSDPFEKPELISCTELQDQPHSTDLSTVNQEVHPVTRSSSCWLVHPPGAAQTHEPPPPEHRSMALCKDLEPYIGLLAETEEREDGVDGAEQENWTETSRDCLSLKETSSTKRHPVVFNNTAYYFLYNRLVDFLSSRDIVSQQISEVVKACQPGEVVIRDALYRLGVAQIKTESADEMEGAKQEVGTATVYEVVLPE